MQNKPGVLLLALVGSFLIYRGGKIALTDKDEQIDYMARTAWGEARGEGSRGMQAVINVIMNRVRAGSWYGATPKEVCTKKSQFSVWNKNDPNYAQMLAVTTSDKSFATAKSLAGLAYAGTLPDITNGATNYLALGSLSSVPGWVASLEEVAVIGNHTFYA